MKSQMVKYSFAGPATYQIVVEGKVEKDEINILGGLSITHTQLSDHTISTLTGEVLDQSELSGVINSLIDYRYSIISVAKI